LLKINKEEVMIKTKYLMLFVFITNTALADSVIIGTQKLRSVGHEKLTEYNTGVNSGVQTSKPLSSERSYVQTASDSQEVQPVTLMLAKEKSDFTMDQVVNIEDVKGQDKTIPEVGIKDVKNHNERFAGGLGGLEGYEYLRVNDHHSKRMKVGVDGYLYFELKKGFLVDNIKSLLADTYAVEPVFSISKNHLVYADMWVKGRTTLDLVDEILVSYTKPFPVTAKPFYNRVIEVQYDEKN
jgi:hypothetical protein